MKKPVQSNFESTKLHGGLRLWIEPNPTIEIGTVFGPHQTSARYVLSHQTYNDKPKGISYDVEGTSGGSKTISEARGRAVALCREHIKRKAAEELGKKALLKILAQFV